MANTNTSPKASLESTAPTLVYKPSSSPPASPNGGGFWTNLSKSLTNERDDRSGAGRDIASTGRGGAGNFVREESTSRTRVNRVEDGDERGRDVAPREGNRVTHAGRGGEGNIRSPSRDPVKEAADRAYEEEVLRKSREHRELFGVSHGRGGGGNISASRSRSREPASAGITVGRGGVGNVEHHIPQAPDLERLDEEERVIAQQQGKHHHLNLFSHGRGGQGNVNPGEDHQPHGTQVTPELVTHSVGRGGVGNVV